VAICIDVVLLQSTPPETAAQEMCELARRTGCVVRSFLEDAQITARPADTEQEVLADYQREVRLRNYPAS
jgi:hypothetical protein